MTEKDYLLEKIVWSDDDFAAMGWHDAQIHAVSFVPDSGELVFDLDYILKWVEQGAAEPFRFWVAPATLVFKNVFGMEGCLGFHQGMPETPTILDITQSTTEPSELRTLHKWAYLIEFDEGELTFNAHGFRQFFRRHPVLCDSQQLGSEERGGISFDRPTLL